MGTEAPERSVVVSAVRGEGDCQFLYYSDQTGRWARVIWRDGPFCARPPSFEIVLSSPDGMGLGGEIGGEMSPYTAIRLACRWVREGR